GAGDGEPGTTGAYAAVPGVRAAAPAHRTTVPLSGNRTATVLALDTARASGTLLMRSDLAGGPVSDLLDGLSPEGATAGMPVPAGTARLSLTARIQSSATASGGAEDGDTEDGDTEDSGTEDSGTDDGDTDGGD